MTKDKVTGHGIKYLDHYCKEMTKDKMDRLKACIRHIDICKCEYIQK